MTVTTSEKLHKVIARTGIGSRRSAEQWIAQGRVSVDGRVAKVGDRVSQSASILLDGSPVALEKTTRSRVLIYHKPVDQISTRKDSKGRTIVFDALPRVQDGRWISVGRLDINTSGLLLFTNDGALANALMHPSSGLEREYLVRVHGDFTKADLLRLKRGIPLDGKLSGFKKVELSTRGRGRNHWYRVILAEGRYREVRRLWESVGGRVNRLIRIRYGPIELPRELQPGEWRELTRQSVNGLFQLVDTQFTPQSS